MTHSNNLPLSFHISQTQHATRCMLTLKPGSRKLLDLYLPEMLSLNKRSQFAKSVSTTWTVYSTHWTMGSMTGSGVVHFQMKDTKRSLKKISQVSDKKSWTMLGSFLNAVGLLSVHAKMLVYRLESMNVTATLKKQGGRTKMKRKRK